MGIASLVLGIISFVIAVTFILAPLGVVLAVIGLILGIVDTVKKGKTGGQKAISITGLVLSAVMFVALIIESFVILVVGIVVYDSAVNYDSSIDNSIQYSISSTELEAFNSKFSLYEGKQSGASVRSLLSTINTNNIYNDDHIVKVHYEGLEVDSYDLRNRISLSNNYNVYLYEDIEGYIDNVYIYEGYQNS